MSLLYIDSFDGYDHLGHKWKRGNDNVDMFTLVSGAGRTGDNALVFTTYLWKQTYSAVYSSTDYRCDVYQALCHYGLGKKIPETNDVIIGCAIKLNQEDVGYLSLELRKGETIQSKIRYRVNEVTVTDASNNVLGTSFNEDLLGRKIMHNHEWNYVEAYVAFGGPASGTVAIRANEYLVYTGTGHNTSFDSNSIDNIRFYMDNVSVPSPALEFARIDDLYVANTSGTTNNNFLGNVNVQTIYPYQDTTYSGFTLASGTASGTAHYTQVTNKQQNNTTEHSHVYWVDAQTDDGCTALGMTNEQVEISGGPEGYSFFRFTNVNIPRKAKINSALLFLTWAAGTSGSPKYVHTTAQQTGYAHAVFNASEISTIFARGTDYDANGRLKIYWLGTYNRSGDPLGYRYDLADILQVLVDRHDWQEVNGAFIIIMYHRIYTTSGGYHRRVYSWGYDSVNGTNKRANITVDFEVPYEKDTYLYTTSTGIKEAFNFDTTGILGSVYGIQQNINTSHIDSLFYSRLSHKAFSVVSGTSYSGLPFYENDGLGTNLSNSYKVYEVNPETNSPWTQQAIAESAFGITTVSGYFGNTDFEHWA